MGRAREIFLSQLHFLFPSLASSPLCWDSNLARKTWVGTRLRKDFPLKSFQASKEYGRGVVRTIVRSTIRFAFHDIRSCICEKIDRSSHLTWQAKWERQTEKMYVYIYVYWQKQRHGIKERKAKLWMKRSKERTFDSLSAKVMFPSRDRMMERSRQTRVFSAMGQKSKVSLRMYILHSKKKYQRPTFRI